MVSISFARCLLTDKTVQADGVNWCSAAALMRDAEVEAQRRPTRSRCGREYVKEQNEKEERGRKAFSQPLKPGDAIAA